MNGTGTEGDYPSHFEVRDALATASLMGARVVRVVNALSTGCVNCLEPAPGVVNERAFSYLDYAIMEARRYHIRLVIPLVNNWSGEATGNSGFWWVEATGNLTPSDLSESGPEYPDPSPPNFYTNPKVVGPFESFVRTVLTHVNSYTGIPYDRDPTIMAWETGNEIEPPVSWTSQISSLLKTLAPQQLVMDGTYGINDGASYQSTPPVGVCGGDLGLANVDLYSNHFYPMNATVATADANAVGSCGKAFVVGEYAWNNSDGGTPLPEFLAAIQGNQYVAGDIYWDLWGHSKLWGFNTNNDGFSLNYPGQTAATRQQVDDLVAHAYDMQGLSVPTFPAPAAPVLNLVTPNRELYWRGSAGAVAYSVERSSAGADGPWSVVCDQCTNDFEVPWQDPSALPSGPVWYRMQAVNADGLAGPWSNVYEWPSPTPVDLCYLGDSAYVVATRDGLGGFPVSCSSSTVPSGPPHSRPLRRGDR